MIKINFFFLVLSFLSLPALFAQENFKGRLLDFKTKEPMPFVNIGVFGKGIGTVSDEDGVFNLPIDTSRLDATDIVQFSSLGYETIKKTVADLEVYYNKYSEILMYPEPVALNEVIVTNKGTFEINDIVGYQNYGEKVFGYWKDNISLGGELATKIEVKKGLRKLNTLFFEVFSSTSDSILVRVNLYELQKGKNKIGKNLNSSKQNILYTIYPNTKLATVDLKPFAIYVKNDFFISLELLKVYGDKPIGLVLAASSNRSTYSARKFASLDTWEVLSQTAMAYHLNTTFYSNKKRADSKVVKAQKSRQTISGFIFSSRRAIENIKITNLITNEETFSNEKGRYSILGEKDDLLSFTKEGYKKITIKLLEKTSININILRQ